MSQIVYLREKRRLRRFFPAIVQIKQTRLRVSFFWADFKLRFKNSYHDPDENDAQGRYESIRSIPVCSRLH